MKSSEIRQSFIDYFVKQGHTYVPSSATVPDDDPTLLFTNAGMNQFKNTFLGVEKRDYSRATNSQKCVRAGGKHNDLEAVGHTARHHTFFEMMGNFSFADYFKKEAIHFAWELLTREFGIDKNRLYVSVFETDDDAADIWHKQEGVAKDRIFRFGEKDNFWRMGETGPCGPNSEIFYDHGDMPGEISDPFKNIESGGDRFVEIWNLVFMQFNESAPGIMTELPNPSIDTGGGLERWAAVLQNRPNNYDTDTFFNIIKTAADAAKIEYAQDPKQRPDNADYKEKLIALRVLADHARCSAFLIADGVLPANEGRGYVLRRIMRRAIRYARNLSDSSLFPLVVEAAVSEMGGFFSELNHRKSVIMTSIKDEENRFLTTLDTGTELLTEQLNRLEKKGEKNGIWRIGI